MILYFLRHGQADDRAEWKDDDTKRPLTKWGEESMVREAEMVVQLDLRLDFILTSPLVRAYQTAKILAKPLLMEDKLIEEARLTPGFGIEKLGEILHDYPKAGALLLVGHEPDFSSTVSALTGGSHIVFKKGGLARIDLFPDQSPPAGELVWLIPPKILILAS